MCVKEVFMKGKFWRKALAAALALLIVSGSTPIQPLSQVFEDIAITASAESTITSVTPQLDSDGFYSIGSAAELYGFAELVNSGNASANAKLTADIVVNENVLDANGEANTGDFVQWTPIGNDYFEGKVYSGTFDGQGYTISGLYVSGSGWYVGFIGEVSGSAVVRNLGIVDSYFSSSNNMLGSIVGGVAEKSSVTIANVYSTSTVKGDNFIGGLVGGDGNGSVTIINSYFAGKTSTGWSYDTHHDDLVAGYFDRSTLTVCNTFVVGTSLYGTTVTAEQMSDGTVAAALHYYQDALADGSMFGLSGGKTNFSGTIDGVSVTTANITLHTFDGDATAYSSKYIVGNTTPLPVMVEREGYTFFGWYDNADLEGDAVTSISSSETGNKEYWAKFERSHAVSFVLGGGTIRSGEIDHYIEGETTALPTFVLKNGASFEGWYTTEDFTGSRYYSIPATATEDMTFYAKWGAEKTTFYLGQGPEPVSILYEGENVVWLDKTTMERYVIFDNFRNYWGSNPGINVPYTGGESTFGYNRSKLSVAQSGFYVFTLTDKGDESWFMSILKSMLNCDVASIPTQVYTGSAIEPAVTVKDGETTLTLGTDYEVTYSDNTNAGTAKATITGKGNYSGTVEKTFAINKATPTVTAPTANTLTYNGGEQELVTAGSTNFGKVLYSLDGTNYSEEVPKGTNAGKYTVYYKVDTDNYYYAPQTVEVTIAESYTITWKNGDEIVETDNYVPGGATPEYNGETPTKADDTMYSYSFAGWAPNVSAVSENAEYTATFTSTPKTYNVTYKVDGVIYGDVDTVAYGTALTARDVPARDGYIFSGWSEIPETMPDHDIEITGTFSVDENYGKLNVADYKSGDTWTAPTQEGKVFAGWFADSEYTTPYMETTGYAYAKFIDERCITVKWQKRLDNPDPNKTDIRLVSTLDCGDYDSLHFVLTFTDNGFVIKDGQITRLYDSLDGFVNGENVSYTPDIFCEDSKCFAAYTVTGMPNSLYDTSLTAKVYIITLDGTRVEGTPLTFRVADDQSNN